MAFHPTLQTTLTIDGRDHRVCEHPSVPGQPHGLDGREATVFRIAADDRAYALKVFKRAYRRPDIARVGARLRPLAGVSGLEVARRIVLDPVEHGRLIELHPDLLYAVVMPWIDGPTWFDVLLERKPFGRRDSQAYAHCLATILVTLEERRFAHSDLSSANIMLAGFGHSVEIQLVDIDQFYLPDATVPSSVAPGSPGYGMANDADAAWSPEKDRFAGAVLLAEMLTWSDRDVRANACQESYFDTAEMQQDSPRYRLMRDRLTRSWGDTPAELFTRAWFSRSLSDCPTFADWRRAIPAPASAIDDWRAYNTAAVASLIKVARHHADRGDVAAAQRILKQAQMMRVAPDNDPAHAIDSLQKELRARAITGPAPTTPARTPTPTQAAKPRGPGWWWLAVAAAALIVGLIAIHMNHG